MNSVYYNVIAVMSGTSMDGIDISYVKLCRKNQWNFHIVHSETVAYSQNWKSKLESAIHNLDITLLDQEYTSFLAEVVKQFISKNQIKNVLALCSHGHTIFHQPDNGITLQIGNLPSLAKSTGLLTVCDFRVQDVQLGGQGAPLVPIGDELLFNSYDYCLNLGGFANVSFKENEVRYAYDICAVNLILNQYSQKLGREYDENGTFAKAGNVIPELLDKLNGLYFYQNPHPKSLGVEWVNEKLLPILEPYTNPTDIIATYTLHVAQQLSKNFLGNGKVLVTGGGAKNSYLIEQLRKISSLEIIVPSDDIIDFKEAVIFGLLGVLRLRNEVNCLSSVTGASRDHSSGKIYVP